MPMSDLQGIQLLALLLVLSMASGGIALAVSPDMRRDLRDAVMQRVSWLTDIAFALPDWVRILPKRELPAQPSLRFRDLQTDTSTMPHVIDPLGPPASPSPPWMRVGTHPPPRYGVAADLPPTGLDSLLCQLDWLDRRHGVDPLRVSMGWTVRRAPVAGALRLETGTFRRGLPTSVVNILNTGQIGSGKDVLLRSMIIPLMLRNCPEAIRFVIIDGKGLDYVGYATIPHVVQLANDIPDIPPVLNWLDTERERRKALLRDAKAKSWADAHEPKPFPLLIVYISELTTLERFVDHFWEWVNDHLSLDRALGICYIIGTQTASNTPTRWRRQVQLFIAGYQPSTDDDRPNTNIGQGGWPEGVIAPSGLPLGGGYFTTVLGRSAINVRAAFITDAEETQALATICQRWGTAPAHESVPVRQGAPLPPDRPKSGAEAPVLAPTANQFMPGSADTDAVRAGSAPVTADMVVRGELSRDELLAQVVAEPLSRDETVRLLAIMRKTDDSDWLFSANKIGELVGGERGKILKQIRATRGVTEEVPS
jgi:hypothetical protein